MFNEISGVANLVLILLWHVGPLLGNDSEISKYTTAVSRQRSVNRNRETVFFCGVRAEM
jgi:hypothetical protein